MTVWGPAGQHRALSLIDEQWSSIWKVGRQTLGVPWSDLPDDAVLLPSISADMVRAAAMTFPRRSGVGYDALAPRCFEHLTHAGLQSVAALFQRVEQTGQLPEGCLCFT